MKQIIATGIVLARTDFGEADRILTVLTKDHGKVRLMAKGVRKIKSKLAGGIELLSISHISFIQGKSDIYTLTSTRLEKHFGNIVEDINRTIYAYEVLKHINRVTEENAEPAYFVLLESFLAALNDKALSQPLIQFWFELQLLRVAGHTPNLRTDSGGYKLEAASLYNFDSFKLSFTKHRSGIYGQHHIKLLRLGLGVDSPRILSQIKDLESILPSCLQLVRAISRQTSR